MPLYDAVFHSALDTISLSRYFIVYPLTGHFSCLQVLVTVTKDMHPCADFWVDKMSQPLWIHSNNWQEYWLVSYLVVNYDNVKEQGQSIIIEECPFSIST